MTAPTCVNIEWPAIGSYSHTGAASPADKQQYLTEEAQFAEALVPLPPPPEPNIEVA
jgi:hypothetical protein